MKKKYLEKIVSYTLFFKYLVQPFSNENPKPFPNIYITQFLYSPFDPDLSTPSNLTSHELSDRNFWFMQHLSNLLTSSGFEQIQELEKPIKGGIFGQGVVVECNTDKYDVFQVTEKFSFIMVKLTSILCYLIYCLFHPNSIQHYHFHVLILFG